MNIFENLENLEVSEECFDDIISIVEEIMSESTEDYALEKANKTKDKAERERLRKLFWKAGDARQNARKAMGYPDRKTKNEKGVKTAKFNTAMRNQARYEADPDNYSPRTTWAKEIKSDYRHNYEEPINAMRTTKAKIRNEKKQYKQTKDPSVLKTELKYPSKYGYNPDAGYEEDGWTYKS